MRKSLLNNNSNQNAQNNQFLLSHQQVAANPANYASGGVMGAPHQGLIGFGTGTSGSHHN